MQKRTFTNLFLSAATVAGLAIAPTAYAQQPAATRAPQGGQATAEGQWLDQLPAGLPVVVRVGGIERATQDLLAMVKAMSPTVAQQYGSQIEGTVSQLTESLGMTDPNAPALLALDVPAPEDIADQFKLEDGKLNFQPRAVAMFATSDYQQALGAIADNPDAKPEDKGGYQVVTNRAGNPIYAIEKKGFAAVSQDESLIKKLAETPQETLGASFSDEMKSMFLEGDVGLYVDLATIAERYADQIELAQTFLRQQVDRLDESGFTMADQARMAYRQVIEAAQSAKTLAANADFAEEGLILSGKLTMEEDFKPLQRVADEGDEPAVELAKLPKGAAYYAFEIVDPETLNWSALPTAEDVEEYVPELAEIMSSPEFKTAKEEFQAAGRMTSTASFGFGEKANGVCVLKPENVESLVKAARSAVVAAKGADLSLFKEISTEMEAEEYEGYTFDKVTATYDFEAFLNEAQTRAAAAAEKAGVEAKNNADPAEAAKVLERIVGESTTIWFGSNGEQVVSIVGEDWDQAKAQIDTYLAGDQGIGSTESYKTVRAALPERVSSLFLVDVQTATRQVIAEVREGAQDESIKAPASMPDNPALIGVAVVAEEGGLRFKGIIPSEVGPVIEKGIVPAVKDAIEDAQKKQGTE